MESDLGKLFIGGISWDTDEERLKDYFRNYGEVVEAVIMRDRATGRARGFGFVVFADPVVAERVIMEKHLIDGRTVEAKKAVPKDDQHILTRNVAGTQGSPGPARTRKIFVGGLASTVTESDFKTYFDQFGVITDVVVMYDHNTQRPRGFGFITYDAEEAVDRVLHKTFHELNGKMVEVKRAVPKELSPGPARSPLIGYNYSLGRAGSLLSSYAQGYNLGPIGGFRMDDRFNQISNSRTGFSPFGSTGYGIGMNLDQSSSPNSNFGNSLGYARMLSPFHNGNGNRYNNPIGYNVNNVRTNNSVLNSPARNVWGNGGGIGNAANPGSPGAYLSSGSGSFGVPFGNNAANWGGNGPGYTGSSFVSGETGGFGFGENGGYGRHGSGMNPPAPTAAYERSYGEIYRSSGGSGGGGSVFSSETAWGAAAPELDGSSSFSYGLDNVASDVSGKTSEDYIGSYNVTSRQPNRGIAA